MRLSIPCFLLCALLQSLSLRAGVVQPDLASVDGNLSRSLFGQGKGVIVGVVDTGIDDTHPALRNNVYSARDFTNSGNTDDAEPSLGHGTGIAGLIVGNDPGAGYLGLAPQAKFINAKVFDDNQASIGNGVIYAATHGAKVINISVGNYVSNADTAELNMICDYLTEKYGVLIVAAAGNDPTQSAVNGVPNGSYNCIAVGSTIGRTFNTVAPDSSIALSSDGRSKPELVAPGDYDTLAAANWESADPYFNTATGTSYASPIVAGIATQMVGYGEAHDMSTDPLILKAILMASAQHVIDQDGSTWHVRSANHEVDGLHILQPLDADQGAGQVNGVAAYDLYAKKTGSTVKYANWKESSLKENSTYLLHLGNFKAGQTLTASMTWLMHINRVGEGPPGLDSSDSFSEASSLADFSLTLLANGKRIAVSDSYADNFEYLSLTLGSSADYSLQVYRYSGYGESNENFGLAAMIDAPTASSSHRSDSSIARPALVRAQSNSVPEPVSVVWIAGLTLFFRRRR